MNTDYHELDSQGEYPPKTDVIVHSVFAWGQVVFSHACIEYLIRLKCPWPEAMGQQNNDSRDKLEC